MALGTFNKLDLANKVDFVIAPLGDNGPIVNDDREIVQTMWDTVRATHSTDMPELHIKNLDKEQSYKWADALKDFVS